MLVERINHRPAVRAPLRDRLAVGVLGVALIYAAVMHGAFSADAASVALVAAVPAVVVGFRRRAVPSLVRLAIGLLLLLALWMGGRAAAVDGAAAMVAGLWAAALAAVAWAVAGHGKATRDALHAVLIAAGLLVAGSGWMGVAWHLDPFALASSGMWRASSTLTYANATAAFLVTVLLLSAAGEATVRVPPRTARLITAVLLLGLLATMSRAGAAALVVGLLVLACSPVHRRLVAARWPAVPGAAIAAAGLLPGLSEGAQARPFVALMALCAGLALAAFAPRRAWFAAVLALVAAAAVAAAIAWFVSTPRDGLAEELVSTRLSADSPERDDLRAITLAVFGSAPVIGVGPGHLELVYVDHLGRLVAAEYAHDEFLQTAAETGIVGAALVVGIFCSLGTAAVTRRRDAEGPPAVAVLAAFALHSALDFLWHIPVLPLLVVVAVVPLLAPSATGQDGVTA